MTSKYIYTGETKQVNGKTLRQIKRVSDGLVGGFVEGDANLSQSGACFVFHKGEAYGAAAITGDAQVYGAVYDSATVGDAATINGEVFGNAAISGSAQLYGKAFDRAIVRGDAKVYGEAFGDCIVEDSATVYGRVYGTAHVGGHEVVYGDRHN